MEGKINLPKPLVYYELDTSSNKSLSSKETVRTSNLKPT